LHRPVTETDTPDPGEPYGWSKWKGERVLLEQTPGLEPVIIRSPTVVDAGRVGLLSILFDFIREGRRVWVVGKGDNRHQFVSVHDLVEACWLALSHPGPDILNVGSDDVPTLRATYEDLIDHAGSGARVASLPRAPALLGMRLAHLLRISPLGPYQYRMIAEDFVFDTSKIQRTLGWKASRGNSEMLRDAYDYYLANRAMLGTDAEMSPHSKSVKMGAIGLLKRLS
jgi:nucleoside-diphosphate-sugar epimerase